MADPRVLFICPSLATGGAERQLSILVPLLQARGFDPAVIALRARGRFFDELRDSGVSTRFEHVRSRFDVGGIRRVLAAAGRWPELVVSQGLDAQLVGGLVARRAGAVHVTVHHKQPELVLAPHRRLLTRLAARRIDWVIAVSTSQIPDLVCLGFPAARIRVIPNGVPDPPPPRPASAVRAELGVDESAFVALFAATLRQEKRATVFGDAVAAAHRANPLVRGIIAGTGPDIDAVRARAWDAVLVLGERLDIADLMGAADVVCLTSSAEALPMVVLEAMAMGRPVISTDVGGIASVVIDGATGILTPVDDGRSLTRAICTLAEDPAALAAMGRRGRARFAEDYSAEVMADRYASALRELLDAPLSEVPPS